MNRKGESCLVTGGAGFIGAELCRRLVGTGAKVVCIDRLVHEKSRHGLKALRQMGVEFVEADISKAETLSDCVKGKRFDRVYHLAANSDISLGMNDPRIDLNDTFLTTFSVLEVMRKRDLKHLVFASTSAVYMPSDAMLAEDDMTQPVSLYGAAKLSSEAYISAYSHLYDMNATVVRFPNVVGRGSTHGVIFDFIRKLRADPTRLQILGNGKQSKPYIFVDDLADAIFHIDGRNNGGHLVCNVGPADTISVDDIADIVIDEMRLKNVRREYTDGEIGWKGDVPRFNYDISKARSLGWEPKKSSRDAVREAARNLANDRWSA
jgi:UDP-glucose 4-epimerase